MSGGWAAWNVSGRVTWWRYLRRRFVVTLIVLVGISFVSFATVYLLPGDPVTSRYPQLAEEDRAAIREEMGLEDPLPVRYWKYIELLARGDLGFSYNTGTPVKDDLEERLPASLELSGYALLLAILIAVPLGIVSAVKRDGLWDHVARLISIATLSVPVFWLGLIAIYLFFYKLNWAPPPVGRLPLDVIPPPTRTNFITVDAVLARDWAAFAAAWKSLALPVAVLGLSLVAPLARITRAAMSEALQEDYVTFARAIGVPERQVVLRDAFRGSQVAVLTMIGYTVGYLIAGNALVEQVFSWPGIGQYAVQAVVTSDFAAVQAVLLIVAAGVALTNLLVDVGYAFIDPRIRHVLAGAS